MRMAIVGLFVALAFVQGNAVSAAADVELNGQQPPLHDWLMSMITQPAAKASASVSAPRTASMYPEPEKDDVCLEVVNSCQDACPDCSYNIRSGVTCGNDHHTDDMFSSLAGQVMVGTCQLSSTTYFDIAQYVDALSGAQIYCAVLCSTLTDTAEQCGPPGCGGSVVTGQGEAYFTYVVTPTNPPGLPSPDQNGDASIPTCTPDARRSSGSQKQSRSAKWDKMLSRFNTTTGRSTGSSRQTGAEFVYLVGAVVYSGPVTLASKTHGDRRGWVQVTLPISSSELPSQALVGSEYPRLDAAMTAQFSKYFFSFNKPRREEY